MLEKITILPFVKDAEVMELVYMYAWGAYAIWLEGSSPFLSIFFVFEKKALSRLSKNTSNQ